MANQNMSRSGKRVDTLKIFNCMLNIAQQAPTTRQEQQIDVKINKIKSKRRCLMSNDSCTISSDSIANSNNDKQY